MEEFFFRAANAQPALQPTIFDDYMECKEDAEYWSTNASDVDYLIIRRLTYRDGSMDTRCIMLLRSGNVYWRDSRF